jgi:general secretion pathway protein M
VKNKWLALWDQQSERDKNFLKVGGIFLFFYLFYAVCYKPLVSGIQRYQQQIHDDRLTLTWMESVKSFAPPKDQTAKTVSSNQLLSEISDSLHQTAFKGYIYQLQQVGTNEIQLSYDAVPYNFFLGWLSKFSHRYRFTIKQLHVEKTNKVGVVKITLLIETRSG